MNTFSSHLARVGWHLMSCWLPNSQKKNQGKQIYQMRNNKALSMNGFPFEFYQSLLAHYQRGLDAFVL
jgi:hypothetical protein